MPSLNWEPFLALPGAPDENFEQLCRILVRRGYGRHGEFRALAQQPGVEFHLKLKDACVLGDPGRWYGWQCRWYDLPSGQSIGSTRRKRIQEAIAKTEQVLPNLTDWVLWTRRPLTKADQEWFYGLTTTTRMKLILWWEAEVEEHLSGDSLIYRRTFFGDLVLTSHELSELHERSVARIRERWHPDLHQVVDAERQIKRKLGQISAWEDLAAAADRLTGAMTAADADLKITPSSLQNVAEELIDVAQSLKTAAEGAYAALGEGDLDHLGDTLTHRPSMPSTKLANLPRQLRSRQNPAVFSITNLLAEVRSSVRLLDALDRDIDERQVAVVAEFGCGKTFLAAQLAGSEEDRPAGILLHGSDLSADGNLDDLASKVVIHGNRVSTMESLLAAIDSAGRREHRRLPILIDGLSEAEDPRKWKGLLAELDEILRLYPYALLVTTVRPEFTVETLPPSICQLEIDGFGQDANAAVTKYFQHYRIDGRDAELPLGLLAHPLTLRLFCEVTNPDRNEMVGIEAMPTSLTALFERYLENSAERIAELSPRTHRYYSQDVSSAFLKIGMALWCQGSRSLTLMDLRDLLGDSQRPWNESLVRALEQDGVLLRVSDDMMDDNRVSVVYDAMAGHLIANALLVTHGRSGFADWLSNPEVQIALFGNNEERHPLGFDVVRALVSLVPRRLYGQQLWTFLDDPMRTEALRGAADLEGRYLDADTINELAVFAARNPMGSGERVNRLWSTQRLGDILDRLWSTRRSPNHPLNSEFLEMVLRPMQVAERDLRWSEWVRRQGSDIMIDLRQIEDRWRNSQQLEKGDRLLAGWVKWLLTSTVVELRDLATRALYWFGRTEPEALFAITVDALSINDPYVSERLLAASYGVAMAHQVPCSEFETALGVYLQGLKDALIEPCADHPSNHQLARLYVRGTIEFGQTFYPDVVPDGLGYDALATFAAAPYVEAIDADDPRSSEVERIFRIDFKNYTLGRLFNDRSNYDMEHPGHMAAVAHVLGTAWEFGWRQDGLGAVDQRIVDRPRYSGIPAAERYGKKYSWAGFYTYAGMNSGGLVHDRGECLSDLHVDPSFPVHLKKSELVLPQWTGPTPEDQRRWTRDGTIHIPRHLLNPDQIDSDPGPWVAVYGSLVQDNEPAGKRAFADVIAVLVHPEQSDLLMELVRDRNNTNLWRLFELPTDWQTFAGEIPWSSHFGQNGDFDPVVSLYHLTLCGNDQNGIDVEILAHRYFWEGHRSPIMANGDAPVPSKAFSDAFALRALPGCFEQVMNDGVVVSKTLDAPIGFDGRLLYLHESLVQKYANGRELIWVAFGERQIFPYPFHEPDWYRKVLREQANIWRYVRKHDNIY